MMDWEIIRRKIEGILSESEEKELSDWMGEDAARQKFMQSVTRYYQTGKLPDVDAQRISGAWERFVSSRQSRVRRIYYRLAGFAALLILAIGSMWWMRDAAEQENRVPPYIASLVPGESKAILILSDGAVVDLQNTAQQNLSDQSTPIHLDSNGLRYGLPDGKQLEVSNTLQIPLGGEYRLTLNDGTRIWLNSNTYLTYPVAFADKERRVHLKGEAYFEVSPDANRPFIVEVEDKEIQVLGTSFNVNAYADEAKMVVTLVNGKVRLQQNGQILKTLHPSDQASWDWSNDELIVQKVNTFSYIQWREGKFVFRDNSLEEIMRILARWYNMEYEFKQPEIKKERFYGVISRYEDVRELLQQFEKTQKVKFEFQGNKILIKK